MNYSQEALDEAVLRLININSPKHDNEFEGYGDRDGYIKVCKVICDYFKAELNMPPEDVIGQLDNLPEEILYMSGLCVKEAELDELWWKHENGAMLGTIDNSTPVALLPGKAFGYVMYDSKQGKKIRVNADIAARISLNTFAVFRMFPSKSLGFKDVISFVLSCNIYKEFAVILLCALITSLIQIIPPIMSAQVFDIIVPENRKGALIQIVLILIAFSLAEIGFSIISNLGISRINTKVAMSLQAAVWRRLLNLRIPFFNGFASGELSQKIKGIERVKYLVSVDNIKTIVSSLFIFVNVIVLFNYCPGITPAVLFLLLSLVVVYAVVSVKKYRLYEKYTRAKNRAASYNHQSISGIHRIKVSCAEERIFNIWSAFEAEKRRIMRKIKQLDNAFDSFLAFFKLASAAVVYFLISFLDDVAIGAFVAYIATYLILQSSLIRLLKALDTLPELISVYRSIKQVLKEEPEYDLSKTIPKDMNGTIEVSHAVFRFEKSGKPVINDVSFHINEGECVGIIGKSGSGKTTLLKLLIGFYKLSAGKIYFGGYDLEALDLRFLRKQMGVVLQDGRLNRGDIYSIITDNNGNIGYEDVMDALKRVEMDETVNALPGGVYARLADYPLSEGEKQRLMIARAIVKKCRFIFLDEAAVNLDNISLSIILKNLRDIPATKIIIAQRYATVGFCDKIIIMDDGKVVDVLED